MRAFFHLLLGVVIMDKNFVTVLNTDFPSASLAPSVLTVAEFPSWIEGGLDSL